MIVGVTGASGLIGRELTAQLHREGHGVVPLRRGDLWDTATGTVNTPELDAVAHLAGEPVSDHRLNAVHKERVRESRVDTTRRLVEGLSRMPKPPRIFISASAVGYYGDRGDDVLDEAQPKGAGFLADVCADWEDAARTSEAHGMRWASLRIGVVLTPKGGALAQMLPPFRAGLGATLGDGSQWVPYISLADVTALCMRALLDDRVRGPVNAVGPEPLTNRGFTKLLGRVLHRPAIARVPRLALRVMYGPLADEALLVSQRAVPKRLTEWGHEFRHPSTEAALRDLLARR